MLREPYNLNPYNSTIDTSLIQPFSFVFSGDKLGSYQIQIAENNKGGEVLYTSPLIEANEIYDGDVVETYLPGIVQTNIDNGDGRFAYVYRLETETQEQIIVPENTNSIEFYYWHDDDLTVDQVIDAENNQYYIFNTTTIDKENSLILSSTGRARALPVAYRCLNAQRIEVARGHGQINFQYYQIQVSKANELDLFDEILEIYNMQIGTHTFDDLSLSSIVESDAFYVINLKITPSTSNSSTSIPYFTFPSTVQYYLYNPEYSSLSDYVGKDLIWRVLMWESRPILYEHPTSATAPEFSSNTWYEYLPTTNTYKQLITEPADWSENYATNYYYRTKGEPQVHNFIRNGQIIARTYENGDPTKAVVPFDACTEVGVLMPIVENFTPISDSFSYLNFRPHTRHCYIDETARCIAIHDNENDWFLYVPITYAFDNYSVNYGNFEFAIVDNIYFTITANEGIVEAPHPYDVLVDPVSGQPVNEYYKIPLTQVYTLEGGESTRTLINQQYYGYELIMRDGVTRTSFDETVTYTIYVPTTIMDLDEGIETKEEMEIVSYATGDRNAVPINCIVDETSEPPELNGTYYIYAQYSTGNVRGYVNNPLSTSEFPLGAVYQLYSNFAFSNWTFFQSRKNPTVELKYYADADADITEGQLLPVVDYQKRDIYLRATYTQWDLIPIRYHQWILRNKLDEVVTDSGQIYDSDLSYTLSPLAEVENYTIELTIVNQNNVVTTVNSMLSTYFPSYFAVTTTPEVNTSEHYASFLWDAALSASPSEDSTLANPPNYGNDIGITNLYRNLQLDSGTLKYNQISGNAFGSSIEYSDFSYRMGFTVDDLLEEYNQPNLTRFDFTQAIIKLDKAGYNLSVIVGSASPIETTLLIPTLGIGQYPTDTSHRGEWLQWIDDEGMVWNDDNGIGENPPPFYWVETSSDTNEFYYQFVMKGHGTNGSLILSRVPYMRGTLTSENIVQPTETEPGYIIIPYNNLLINQTCHLRSDNNVTVVKVVDHFEDNNDNGNTMRAVFDSPPTTGEYTIYATQPSELQPITFSPAEGQYLNSFEFNPKINLYYSQLQSVYVDSDFAPLEDLEKPSWEQGIEGKFILLDFNDSLQSHQGGAANQDSLPIYAYEVYRVKYASEEDAKSYVIDYKEDPTTHEKTDEILGYTQLGKNEIYTRYIGTVNLRNENLISAAQIKFYDWTIENNGWYRYKVIPLGTTFEKILYSDAFQTNWYGWSFTSFEPSNGHYDMIERWNYYLNLETKGYSHVTNKVFHQGFNRYPKVSVGSTDYITSDMTGLIGEFRQTCDRENAIYGNYYEDDNIERIYNWENFINDGHLILVKDYKGRAYIAQLDGGATNFQDVEDEILSTTSFNITQVGDVAKYPIFQAVNIADEIRGKEE